MKPSDHGSADLSRRWLYEVGGLAALFGVAIIPVQLVVFVVWGQPNTVPGWFDLFGSNRLGGLLAFEVLFVVNAVVGISTALALYVILRRLSESFMAIALALGLLQAVSFVMARPALEMLYLSNQYADATTDARRAALLAAGETMLATFHGTAFHVGINLFSVYFLIVPIVMLRGEVFGRVTAYAGIAAAILNWGLYVPGGIGVFLLTLSVIPLAVWNVLIARRLLQLGRGTFETRSLEVPT
ncbi:DUF4386 family protein [Rubrobacter tropicus]|uniref:DUF4386 family protein n=1 Tax=Rubrobacter tropicus TaxID=2653851 RepID=A0A6G8QDZ6_9ACTN|nr:DUF4386 family protein [Rubrobacter tropicus]QIN84716.1 DUF4386 family protein [Rubrobacter tropicus]